MDIKKQTKGNQTMTINEELEHIRQSMSSVWEHLRSEVRQELAELKDEVAKLRAEIGYKTEPVTESLPDENKKTQ